jgi:hypothetical protein
MHDLEMLQDVLVFDVAVEGADVSVDIYGSRSNVCGSIRFTFEERAERAAQVRLLRRWQQDGTPLTFVSHGSTVALTNDAALMARAGDEPALG